MKRTRWISLCVWFLVGCSAPLEAPPALEGETFLCDAEHLPEFEAQLDACRAARALDVAACAGVMSYRGTVDSQYVVMDGLIERIEYSGPHLDGTAELSIVLYARSPYYAVQLDMTAGSTEEDLSVAGGLTESTYLNFEARGGNYLSNVANEAFDIRLQTLEEARTWLTGDLARGGSLELCFHAFLPPL